MINYELHIVCLKIYIILWIKSDFPAASPNIIDTVDSLSNCYPSSTMTKTTKEPFEYQMQQCNQITEFSFY